MKIQRALFSRGIPFEKLTCMCFVMLAKTLTEHVHTLCESLNIIQLYADLLLSLGRVAPLKAQYICRLELMGALIATRLAKTLTAELTTKIEKMTFRSDSTTVLHWIHQTSSNYNAFVEKPRI